MQFIVYLNIKDFEKAFFYHRDSNSEADAFGYHICFK